MTPAEDEAAKLETTTLSTRSSHPLLIGVAVMLVAFNLRPALTSIGPLLTGIRAETDLSATGAAVLTTLPVLCLGLGGVISPWAIRRAGIDRSILLGLIGIVFGLALRGIDGLVPLFAGTVLCGLGIGVAGVLLPALVKRDFAGQLGRMTGLYTMSLCLGAAIGTALSVPLREAIGQGYAPALAIWGLPALAGILIWLPFADRRATGAVPPSQARRSPLWRDPLAWQVTGFMGMQSSLAYIQFGWLPALLQARGLDALDAGYLAGLTTLGQAPGALAIPILAGARPDQRGWIVAVLVATVAAFLTMALGPHALMVPAGLLVGIGIGACFGLGLTVIVLRAHDAASAGSLSAMAQGVGYSIAALGPFGFGLAHEATGGWGLACAIYAGIGLLALVCGLGAGRDRHVGG